MGYSAPEDRGPDEGEHEQLVQRESFSKFIPYAYYDDESGEYMTRHDSYGFLWECRPVTFMSNKTLASILSIFKQEMPKETVLSFSLYPDSRIERFVDAYVGLKTRKDDLSVEAARRYAQHMMSGADGMRGLQGIPTRNFRLFVSIKSPKGISNELFQNVQENLSAAGLSPEIMPPGPLLDWLRGLLNDRLPEYPEAYSPGRPIASQVLLAETDVSIVDSGMKFGSKYVACLTPKSMPERAEALTTNRLIGGFMGKDDDSTMLNHEFLWTTSVFFKASKKEVQGQQNRMGWQRMGGSWAKSIARRLNELDWVLDDIDKIPYVNVFTTMLIFGDSKKDVDEGCARARGLWEKVGYVMQREGKKLARVLIPASLPMGLYLGLKNYSNVVAIERDFPVSALAAVELLPVQGDYMGGMRPVVPFIGRKGQLIGLDVYDENANNHNFYVAAQSGAGKSFVLNFLVSNYYTAGAFIRCTDIGDSYLKQCRAVGGRYIDIGGQADKICLNPFVQMSLPDDENRLENSKGNESITANVILTMIYSSTGTANVDEVQYSLVKDAVRYAQSVDGGLMGIDHVYQYLRNYPKLASEEALPALSDLAHRMAFTLRDFTSKGKYGPMFNGKSTLNIADDQFVVMEMDRLLGEPELFRVVSMQVINAITQDLYTARDRSIRRFMLFDEAWKYLGADEKTPSAPTYMIGGVISEGYRRARKYGGSTGIVTQSPLDFLAFGPAGSVINSNSAFKFLLQSDAYSKAVDAKILEYQGLELDLARSVKNHRPHYSEILLDTPFGKGIGRLCVDRWTYWLNTSTGSERDKFMALMEKGVSPRDAITKLATEG